MAFNQPEMGFPRRKPDSCDSVLRDENITTFVTFADLASSTLAWSTFAAGILQDSHSRTVTFLTFWPAFNGGELVF